MDGGRTGGAAAPSERVGEGPARPGGPVGTDPSPPRIQAICVARDEADILRLALTHAAGFCHRIYFVDHSSTDGSWRLVEELAREIPAIVPFAQRSGRFGRGIHAHVFNQMRGEHRACDWWMILDADEFLEEDPRPLLARHAEAGGGIPFDMVRFLQAQFMITEADLETPWFTREAGEIVSMEELPRHYRFDWIETRLFRNAPGLEWPELTPDGRLSQRYLPRGLKGAHSREILNRHYQHRSRTQIQSRLCLRAEQSKLTGEFAHVSGEDWRSVVMSGPGVRHLPPGRFLTCSWWERARARWRKRRKRARRRRLGMKRDVRTGLSA